MVWSCLCYTPFPMAKPNLTTSGVPLYRLLHKFASTLKTCSLRLQMCTFSPKLNKRPLSDEWAGSVIERSQAWQARRDQKVHEAREQDADKDLQGCTFWSVLYFPLLLAHAVRCHIYLCATSALICVIKPELCIRQGLDQVVKLAALCDLLCAWSQCVPLHFTWQATLQSAAHGVLYNRTGSSWQGRRAVKFCHHPSDHLQRSRE